MVPHEINLRGHSFCNKSSPTLEMRLVNKLTLDIKVNLSRVNEVDAPPADIIPGLTVVQSTVAGLDVRDGVLLS